jgi:type IV fimbrial biogenesis protein FimT
MNVIPGIYRARSRGVTLIELMVTVAMVAVLAAVATPSYRSFVVNQQLSTASGEFLSALLQARSEALRLGKQTMVVPINEIEGPSASSYSWLPGWCVFVDSDGTGTYSSSTSTLVNCTKKRELSGFVSVITGSGFTSGPFGENKPFFAFSPAGFAVGPPSRYTGTLNGKLWLRASATGRDRAIIVSRSGRARICDPKLDATAATPTPCSAD